MLYLIGMGLHDEKDLSLKAIEALRKCDRAYVEMYTSRWFGDLKDLEKLAGKPIIYAERAFVESLQLVKEALKQNVALLVPGDPLTATTHIELLIEAKKLGIPVEVIHSSSIYTAIAECGLQSYKFGRITSVTFPEPNFDPASHYEVIAENKKSGLHSLVLLDVKPPHYMTVKEALELLLKKEAQLKKSVIGSETEVIAAAELGGDKMILYGTVAGMIKKDPRKVPAVLIIPGSLHFKEEEALSLWKI